MKLAKLLEKVERFLSAAPDEQEAERKSVRELLRKLKDKERTLRARLEETVDADERDALTTRLEVVQAQRKKGVERIKALRKKRNG